MRLKERNGYRMDALIALMIVITISMFASFGAVYALTGTSGGITLNGGIGAVSYDANSSSINAVGLGEIYAGTYDTGTGITGRFGLGMEQSTGSGNLSVNLMMPSNDSAITSDTVDMRFNASGVSGIISGCSLYVDGTLQGVYDNVMPDSAQILSLGISIGRHYWNVSCTYNSSTAWSNTRAFTRVVSSFTGNSTDLSSVNISSVPNLTVSSSGVGDIRFAGFTDLSSGGDLDANIIIGYLSIYLNSASLPALNKPATLTIYNVPYNNPIIRRDGSVCNDCTVQSFNSGTLVFNVTGFSNYTLTSNARLAIYDESDTIIKHAGDNITFYANYTNATSGAPISGACMVSFNVGGWTAPAAMTYNSSSGMYYYMASFNASMSAQYNVSCTNILGFDNLYLLDSFTISSGIPITFSDTKITFINSSKTVVNNAPANVTSRAGNLTELTIDAKGVSTSWQGYYGNVTGKITLGDSSNHTLYNWNMASPHGEIYAARNTAVKWYNIRCANTTEMSSEDSYLGMDNTYSESIQRTFYNTSTFGMFYAGNVNINTTQNCYSTHLYNSTGQSSAYYSEILLTDGSNMVYTGIISSAVYGFDARQHDFEMLVGENGQGNAESTMYYFYVEMG